MDEDAERKMLAGLFRTDLAAAEAAREAPDDAEVAAYLDGTLDEADREVFVMRLEDDPLLRAEVDAVATLRRELGQRRRPTATWAWAAAAALAAAIGAALLWQAQRAQAPVGAVRIRCARQWTVSPTTRRERSAGCGGNPSRAAPDG